MRGPVAGWKAGLVIIGALIVVFALLNKLGVDNAPVPAPKPSPTVIY